MRNSDNSLLVASFKNIDGEVVKTISFRKNRPFNQDLIPKSSTSYYLYSKKGDKYSKDTSCQIGIPLRMAVDKNRQNLKLLAFLSITERECAYLITNDREYVVPIETDTKLVNSFEDLITSFKSDIEDLKENSKQYAKKM